MTTVIHSARKLDAHGEVDSFWMLVDGDTIVSTGHGAHPDATTVVDAAGAWLVPGFIDLHGHGGGGFSFDDGPESILAALAMHRSRGTTRSLISLVANPLATLRTSLSSIADLVADDPLILGAHLEGGALLDVVLAGHDAFDRRIEVLTLGLGEKADVPEVDAEQGHP